MNKICTSIEQSKKLIELGIDVNTADMFWDTAEPNERRKPLVGPISDYCDMEDWAVPAWSLAVLLNILPVSIYDNTDEYSQLEFSKISVAYHDINDGIKVGSIKDNLVDACYEVILKLHELNLL